VKIWVDADATPVAIKEILYRAAERTRTETIFVANTALKLPSSAMLRSVVVAKGFDVADNEIVKRMQEGDLVITADIPLAADVLAKGGLALNPRGELYSTDTIKAKLSMRDFLDTLRASGVATDGPASFSDRDKRAFAGKLDTILAAEAKNRKA
jgi:uncharacterized protein YaiI (UPF0178 family)